MAGVVKWGIGEEETNGKKKRGWWGGGGGDSGEVISRIVWCVITDLCSCLDYELLGWKLFVIKARLLRGVVDSAWRRRDCRWERMGGRCWGKMVAGWNGWGCYRIRADQKQFENWRRKRFCISKHS